MELLKQAQSGKPIDYKGGTIYFCKSPDPFELKYVFKQLLNPTGRFFFVYYSDDSCLVIKMGDKLYRFNLDISSCDSSHSPALFELLKDLFPQNQQSEIQRLIDQCMSPLVIRATQDRKMKVVLKPTRPMLYSGSTITTAINNLANILIAYCIANLDVITPETLESACARAGYIVTGLTPLEHFEDLQFLKHSPVRDAVGDIHPMLNLGVLLRSSGTCFGDFPGRGPIQPRVEQFQKALLQGMYPRANCTLLDNMRSMVASARDVPLPPATLLDLQYKVTIHENRYLPFTADPYSLYLRYRLDDFEISALEEEFGRSGYGEYFNHSAASKILTVDYGLQCTDYQQLDNNRGFEDSHT
jgi:hypothetical protein